MKATVVSQYSVFLINEAGALKKLAQIIEGAGLDITGLSSDVRYEAAVVKFVTSGSAQAETSRLITQAGYTSVKTDVICVEVISKPGIMARLGDLLGGKGINITTIYGSAVEGELSRVFLVVDNIEAALEVLTAAKDI